MGDKLDDGVHENLMRARSCCPVVELRQYTLHPGRREVLIELFEREFIESQEAAGMTVIGQFRDLQDPDRFVWLRGFENMTTRGRALQEFYGGPIWQTHRHAANATMIDSDDVLLLRPAQTTSGFALEGAKRPPRGSSEFANGIVAATICHLIGGTEADFTELFESTIRPILVETGATVSSYFVTEHHPNTVPALPVREDADVFAWFLIFADLARYDTHLAALARCAAWTNQVSHELARRLKRAPQLLKLQPTPRSLLRV